LSKESARTPKKFAFGEVDDFLLVQLFFSKEKVRVRSSSPASPFFFLEKGA